MDRRATKTVLVCLILGGVLISMASAKTCRTYYDDERLAVMRENLEKYDWARSYRDSLVAGDGEEKPWRWGGHRYSVDVWAQRDDEFFWELMPSTKVTMVYELDKYGISPKHGTAVRNGRAFYHPWNYDPFNHPYKIQDPVDGEWYPSNDFGKGDMTSGSYPDDGTGMVYEGTKYYPIREYSIATYLHCVVPLMERMSQAYLLTGNEEYAHKCAVLLSKVAYEYPNPTDKADRCQKKPWDRYSGLVTDYIWETFKLTSMAKTYDAIYDAIGEDEALAALLKEKGLPVETPQDVRRYIEESILRIGMLALKECVVRGNQGFHQETGMALALVMDDHESTDGLSSKDIVDWVMYGEGQMAYIMSNYLFRDGAGFESPGYNEIKFDFISAAQLFEQLRKRHPDIYPADAYPDIWANPKAHAMFDYFLDLTVLNRFLPPIGDSGGGTLVPKHFSSFAYYAHPREHYDFGYEKYGDPRYARVYVGEGENLPRGNPFERYMGEELLAAAKLPAAEIVRKSRVLDGYGFAYLRSGEDEDARCLLLNYSNHFQHIQQDRLCILLYNHNTDCLPDMGYPFTWEYRDSWDANPYIHNTVVVDETMGKMYCPRGRLVVMAEEGPLHVATAAHDPYVYDEKYNSGVPRVSLYERTCAMVDVSDTEYYVVDLFLVSGGSQHDQSWHGPICPIEKPPLDWQDQPTGTLAGPDVAQFAKWTDSRGREQTGPFSFLKDVSRATASTPSCFTWNMGLDYNAKLRINVVPVDGPVELVMSNGRSPARPPDWSLDYLFVRRSGEEGMTTRFLTVLDTHPGDQPAVKNIALTSHDPLTLAVTHSEGVDEIVLNVPTIAAGEFLPRNIGVTLKRDGQTWQIGSVPGGADGYLRGTISACDYPNNVIEVQGLEAAGLEGRFARIYTANRSSTYRIVAAEEAGGGAVRLHLDQTNMLFEALISGFDDSRLHNSAALSTWTAREEEGKLRDYRIWNRDAVIVSEDGKAVRRMDGVAEGKTIYVQGSPSAAELEREFTDANGDGRIMANAYDYAVGAEIEIARSAGSR